MLEVARAMAEKGASRAEIEAAIAAMQTGKAPAARRPLHRKKQPGAPQRPRPGAVMPPAAAASSRRAARGTPPRSAAPCWRRSQRRQAEREAARQAEAQAEEDRFRSYRDREVRQEPRGHTVRSTPSPLPLPAATRRLRSS